jgi:hypothetical protein
MLIRFGVALGGAFLGAQADKRASDSKPAGLILDICAPCGFRTP